MNIDMPLVPQLVLNLIKKNETVLLFAGHQNKGRVLDLVFSPSETFIVVRFEDLVGEKTQWIKLSDTEEHLVLKKEGGEWHLITKDSAS